MLTRGSAAGVLGLAAAILPDATTGADRASAAAGNAPGRACPTGTWRLDVTLIEIHRTEQSHYAFTGDGIVMHVSNNGFIGLGAWRATGARTFSFSFREFVLANDGTVEGEVRVHIDARLTSAAALTGTGRAQAYDLSGNPLYTVHSTVVGARFGLEG